MDICNWKPHNGDQPGHSLTALSNRDFRGTFRLNHHRLRSIKENIEEADVLDKGVLQLLGDKLPGIKTIGELFKSPERVARARQAFSSFIKHTKEDLGWSDAKIKRYVATMYKGMYASASKIGDGSIILIDGVLLVADYSFETLIR